MRYFRFYFCALATLALAGSLPANALEVVRMQCTPGSSVESATCTVETRGVVRPTDALVFEHTFGKYTMTVGDKLVGSNEYLGTFSESFFIPKVFPLASLQGTPDPTMVIHCEPITRGLGIPSILNASSNVAIMSLSDAQLKFYGAILVRLAMLLMLAALAIYALPLWKNGGLLFPNVLAPRLFYICGLIFAFSMTRVPRFFAPVLMNLRVYYYIHDISEYLMLWAACELLTMLPTSDHRRIFQFANLICLIGSAATLILAPNISQQLMHCYLLLFWCTGAVALFLYRLARLKLSFETQVSTYQTVSFLTLGFAMLLLDFEAFRQTFVDFSLRSFCGAGFAACIFVLAKTLRLIESNQSLETSRALDEQINASLTAAHDIRSPLSALLVLSDSLSPTQSGHRELLKSATKRILDISNKMLNRPALNEFPKPNHITERETDVETRVTRQSIELFINEKRTEFSNFQTLQIIFDIPLNFGTAIVQIPVSDLFRSLSNLINNAAEALSHRGVITVVVYQSAGQMRFVVEDNGPGIPLEKQRRLGELGYSFNKPYGRGLGLWQVSATVSKAGGTWSLTSASGQGTKILLEIPFKSN